MLLSKQNSHPSDFQLGFKVEASDHPRKDTTVLSRPYSQRILRNFDSFHRVKLSQSRLVQRGCPNQDILELLSSATDPAFLRSNQQSPSDLLFFQECGCTAPIWWTCTSTFPFTPSPGDSFRCPLKCKFTNSSSPYFQPQLDSLALHHGSQGVCLSHPLSEHSVTPISGLLTGSNMSRDCCA